MLYVFPDLKDGRIIIAFYVQQIPLGTWTRIGELLSLASVERLVAWKISNNSLGANFGPSVPFQLIINVCYKVSSSIILI